MTATVNDGDGGTATDSFTVEVIEQEVTGGGGGGSGSGGGTGAGKTATDYTYTLDGDFELEPLASTLVSRQHLATRHDVDAAAHDAAGAVVHSGRTAALFATLA